MVDSRWHFEDFHVGQIVPLGHASVTDAAIRAFAAEFDPVPAHLDPDVPGGLTASPWHVAGVFMRLFCEVLLLRSTSLGSPGIDELDWLEPVRPGDDLSAELTVVEVKASRSRPGIGLTKFRSTVRRQDGAVVMTAQSWSIFGRREGTA